jgi:predicted ATPase
VLPRKQGDHDGGHQLSSYDLPTPERGTEERLSREYFREVDYDQELLVTETDNLQQQLTDDQREVYNSFFELLERGSINNRNIIFLDAPGGTGKSFVINAIL